MREKCPANEQRFARAQTQWLSGLRSRQLRGSSGDPLANASYGMGCGGWVFWSAVALDRGGASARSVADPRVNKETASQQNRPIDCHCRKTSALGKSQD